ncbi:MAG: translation initiation factor IF-2 [Clostridiales bacterium]|jgi:translation initiation factor IF-2|nr:translation initiation factor IF-2 [Clostridiales bacterium]
MMIKYRVHEVAKDLNVPSKEIVDLLQKHFGEVKKHMTALNEAELDVIFEHYTQARQLESFDAYFARQAKEEPEQAEQPAVQEPLKQPVKQQAKPVAAQNPAKPAAQQGQPAQQQGQQPKRKAVLPGKITPVGPKPAAQQPPKKPAAPAPQPRPAAQPQRQGDPNSNTVVKPAGRIINTRSTNVNIDKYNEKYDRLASEKVKVENTVQKQKITQRSQQRGRPRNSRKETEAERLRRIAMERKAKPITVSIPDEITVGELALRLKATAAEVIKKLMMMGSMCTVNDTIDFDTATLVAMEFHAKVEKEVVVTIEDRIIDDSEDEDDNLVPRAPVVVVMGHVDHGKTSLLDAIRHANVTAGEAGGITQHIGAYRVGIGDREITFLDTPGHEAFTTMRARGAQVTDIAILVVAADDGIMPQTVEAINHAKAAGVSVVVAINKMDKISANPDRVKQQLTEYELVPEEWGGDTPCIPVSAATKQGIDDLLEMVTLIADMKELKANPDRAGKGTVIEARLDKGRGPIATVLVQNGTLKIGDIIVAGTSVGRVRAMMNDRGERVQQAGPSIPVEITGLDDVPSGGDTFNCVSDERLARELVEQRRNKIKEEQFNAQTKVTLDNLFDQMQQGEMKELKIIVKADVQGSVEAVRQSLLKLTNDEVRVNVIHGGVGAVNESDVMLANASNAIIVGFNVRPDPVAAENAERDGVDMRLYRVIYDCIEEIESAMKGMLAPKFRENLLGRVECRQVYKITNVGVVAGSYVLSGKVVRNAEIRVVRDGIVIAEDKMSSLRRFKDDVKEVAQGYECGIGLEKFNDIKEGDIFEAFIMEEYKED